MEKVLIIDSAAEWRTELSVELGESYCVAHCGTGTQALAMLEEFQPSVVILDLMLPGNDGLSILKALSLFDSQPGIIATSRYYSDYLMKALDDLHVDYLAMKPCSMESLRDRVADLVSRNRSAHTLQLDPDRQINAVLWDLSVPTSQSGYHYIREGILLLMQDPRQQLTKSLYPAIAALHNISDTAVEKAIRTTVSTAWKRRNDTVWRNYFHAAPNGQVPKPTSGQFLTRIAESIAGAGLRKAAGR